MKSKLIYIILLLSFSTSIMAQPVTTLPYYCSFEDSAENAQWTFAARPAAAPNRWTTGTAISRSGAHSMYVSSDAGVSASYIDDGSTGYCIVASREFALPMGSYDLSFNWKAAGDQGISMYTDELDQNTTKDEFRVAWVPVSVYSTLLVGGSSVANDFPNYALTYSVLFTGRDVFSGAGAWQTALGQVNVSSNENYRLMFIWKIDGDARKTDPAACIDNIQIVKKATSTDCWKTPAFTIDTVAGGINISWNAIVGAVSYDLIYFAEGSLVMDTITGITGSSYFIPYTMLPNGRYCFLMRSICPDGTMGIWSEKPNVKVVDWVNIQLVPQACPELSFNASEIDHSSGIDIIHPDCKGNSYTIRPTIGATSGRVAGYSVIPISYDPPYPIGPAPGANLIFSNNAPDDSWGEIISLPFPFCFFEYTYTKARVGANGQITFDTSHPAYAGGTNPYDFTANDNIPNTEFLPQGKNVFNSIFGVYEDIDPSQINTLNAGVYAGILGVKPCRTLCVSFKDIPCFGNNQFKNSYQMVLYEGSNVIEVYIDRRNNKSSTNLGKGIIGVINADGSDGIAAPGRNVSDTWQVLNDDQREAWRFVPIQSPTYEMAWYKGAGVNGAKLGKDTILTVFEGDGNDTITVRMQFTACNEEHFDLRDTAIIIWNPLDSVFVDEVVCYGETCVNPYFQETQAGTYSKMLTSAAGCDSAYYTLNLKVQKPVSYYKLDTICAGETYSFYGVNYDQSGIYPITKPFSTTGCDSLRDTLFLTVLPSVELPVVRSQQALTGLNSGSIEIDNIPTGGFYTLNGVANASLNHLTIGEYTVVTYNSFGCASAPKIIEITTECLEVQLTGADDLNICADENSIAFSYNVVKGYADTYSLVYDSIAGKAGFTDITNVALAKSGTIIITLPENAIPNNYSAILSFNDINCQSDDIQLTVYVKYPTSTIRQKWNDVLAVTNAAYNGGYTFSDFQWFRNGFPMFGENGSYIYLKNGETFNVSDYYQVGLVRVGEKQAFLTCSVYPTVHSDVVSFPTYIQHGQMWMVNGLNENVNVQVWDALSVMRNQGQFHDGNISIRMPNQQGVYQVRIISYDGTQRNISVLVY